MTLLGQLGSSLEAHPRGAEKGGLVLYSYVVKNPLWCYRTVTSDASGDASGFQTLGSDNIRFLHRVAISLKVAIC